MYRMCIWQPDEHVMINDARNRRLQPVAHSSAAETLGFYEQHQMCRKFTQHNKLISLSDRLLTGERLLPSFIWAPASGLRISLAWKTNSSVMESSLMKALSFEQDLDVVAEVGWQW